MGRMHAQYLDLVVGIIINSPAVCIEAFACAHAYARSVFGTVPGAVVLVGQGFARTHGHECSRKARGFDILCD
jgi:hypothetical protein